MEIKEFKGKTIIDIKKVYEYEDEDDKPTKLIFTMNNGEKYKMYHRQDCCELVWLEDIVGNLDDLIGKPLVMAEEETNENKEGALDDWDDSYTWTYYKFATIKGYVTLRWYGTSNGYYSEDVDIEKINKKGC